MTLFNSRGVMLKFYLVIYIFLLKQWISEVSWVALTIKLITRNEFSELNFSFVLYRLFGVCLNTNIDCGNGGSERNFLPANFF